MSKIKITTAQNIDIEYDIADPGMRIGAWLLDFFIIVLYIIVVSMFASPARMVSDTTGQVTLLLLIQPAFFYHLIMELLLNGRSPGKLAMGLQVISLDGRRPHVGQYLMRWIFRLLETNLFPFLCLPGTFAMLMSEKGQRIADMLAHTAVISVRPRVQLEEARMPNIPEGYLPQFQAVTRLRDRDIHVLRETVRHLRASGDRKPLVRACNRVCRVLQLRPPEGMSAEAFAVAVVRDYYVLTAGT